MEQNNLCTTNEEEDDVFALQLTKLNDNKESEVNDEAHQRCVALLHSTVVMETRTHP